LLCREFFAILPDIEQTFYMRRQSMTGFIRRIINFEELDWAIVQRAARQEELGGKGYSAALRGIIRQWAQEHLPAPLPVHAPLPPGSTGDLPEPDGGQDGDPG